MQNVHIDYRGPDHSFLAASHLAKDVAKQNQMGDPTIVSWHRSSRIGPTDPFYEGANPDTWWEKFGEGNGGKLEISVGNDDYQFIMMDTRGYETVGELPLRNLTDSGGNQYLCYTPIQGRESAVPKKEACTLLDDWAMHIGVRSCKTTFSRERKGWSISHRLPGQAIQLRFAGLKAGVRSRKPGSGLAKPHSPV